MDEQGGAEEQGKRLPAVYKGKRRTGRKSLIGSSPYRDEYVRLMRAGWSSTALERYASYRYGETIPATTFRTYKSRLRIDVDPGVLVKAGRKNGGKMAPSTITKGADEYGKIDVLLAREQLADLQMRRIAIDADTEAELGKLFSTTGREIDLLGKLLDQIKADQRDYGILPDVGDELRQTLAAKIRDTEQAAVPQHRTLGEVIGGDEATAMRLVEAMANVVPLRQQQQNGAAG